MIAVSPRSSTQHKYTRMYSSHGTQHKHKQDTRRHYAHETSDNSDTTPTASASTASNWIRCRMQARAYRERERFSGLRAHARLRKMRQFRSAELLGEINVTSGEKSDYHDLISFDFIPFVHIPQDCIILLNY